MKHLLLLLVAAFLAMASTAHAVSILEVIADKARLRSGPGTEHEILGTLNKGAALEGLGGVDNWQRVYHPEFGSGYIYKTLVREKLQTKSGGLQAERLKFIQRLIDQGVVIKVEKLARFPHVYVGRAFKGLTFAAKRSFISVVYMYYAAADPQAKMALLFDGYTGKQIGTFSPTLPSHLSLR